MSRSYRNNPITGLTTARTEKQDKRIANRRLRRRNTLREHRAARTGDDVAFFVAREVSNVWAMDKDGKMRFDPVIDPQAFAQVNIEPCKRL